MATKKNGKEYPTDSAFVWLKRNDAEYENAPYLKGFVSLPPELVRGNTALESICYYDSERDNYNLDICLWKKGNGVLSGLISKSWKLKDDIDGDDLDLDDEKEEEEEDTIPFAFESETPSTTKRKRR